MVNFLKRLVALIAGLLGMAAPSETPTQSGKPKKTARPRPSKATPMPPEMPLWEAVNAIAASAGQFVPGGSQSSDRYGLDRAWLIVDEPLGAVLRALIHLKRGLPVFNPGRQPAGLRANAEIPWIVEQQIRWTYRVCSMPSRRVPMVIEAIWDQAELAAYQDVDDVLARQVEVALDRLLPTVIRKNGPPAKRERHVRDRVRTTEHPLGRVIIARLYEYGEGGELKSWTTAEAPCRSALISSRAGHCMMAGSSAAHPDLARKATRTAGHRRRRSTSRQRPKSEQASKGSLK